MALRKEARPSRGLTHCVIVGEKKRKQKCRTGLSCKRTENWLNRSTIAHVIGIIVVAIYRPGKIATKFLPRRATKFILKTDDTDYPNKVDLFLFDVLLFYKVLKRFINIDISPFINFCSDSERYSRRGRNNWVLKRNYARTDIFKFSFF